MNAFLKLAQILFFVLFLSSHTVSDIQQCLARMYWPLRESLSLHNRWRRKLGGVGWSGVGPHCPLSCCSGPHRWTGNCTGCWEQRLWHPARPQHRPAMEQRPQDPLPSHVSCSKFRGAHASPHQPSSRCASVPRLVDPEAQPRRPQSQAPSLLSEHIR